MNPIVAKSVLAVWALIVWGGVGIYITHSTPTPKPQVAGLEITPTPSPTNTPTPPVVTNRPVYKTTTSLINCIGPDGKTLELSQADCDKFNSAWTKPTPLPQTTTPSLPIVPSYQYQPIPEWTPPPYVSPSPISTPTPVSKIEADSTCQQEANSMLPDKYGAALLYSSCMGGYGYSVAIPAFPQN